jgi:hypothetical protein
MSSNRTWLEAPVLAIHHVRGNILQQQSWKESW